MMTVKLFRGLRLSGEETMYSTKIIEADEVNVHWLICGELAEVSVEKNSSNVVFYVSRTPITKISNDCAAKFAEIGINPLDAYRVAYIENSSGSTVETVQCA